MTILDRVALFLRARRQPQWKADLMAIARDPKRRISIRYIKQWDIAPVMEFRIG